MRAFDRVAGFARSFFTTEAELQHFKDSLNDLESDFRELRGIVVELRDRVARIEAFRDADRAQLEAELARFKLEVERLLLTTRGGEGRALTEGEEAR